MGDTHISRFFGEPDFQTRRYHYAARRRRKRFLHHCTGLSMQTLHFMLFPTFFMIINFSNFFLSSLGLSKSHSQQFRLRLKTSSKMRTRKATKSFSYPYRIFCKCSIPSFGMFYIQYPIKLSYFYFTLNTPESSPSLFKMVTLFCSAKNYKGTYQRAE